MFSWVCLARHRLGHGQGLLEATPRRFKPPQLTSVFSNSHWRSALLRRKDDDEGGWWMMDADDADDDDDDTNDDDDACGGDDELTKGHTRI